MRRRRRAARIVPSLFCECSFRLALRMWFRTVYELRLSSPARGILKKCVNSQAVYPLSEQHGLEAQERR